MQTRRALNEAAAGDAAGQKQPGGEGEEGQGRREQGRLWSARPWGPELKPMMSRRRCSAQAAEGVRPGDGAPRAEGENRAQGGRTGTPSSQ